MAGTIGMRMVGERYFRYYIVSTSVYIISLTAFQLVKIINVVYCITTVYYFTKRNIFFNEVIKYLGGTISLHFKINGVLYCIVTNNE